MKAFLNTCNFPVKKNIINNIILNEDLNIQINEQAKNITQVKSKEMYLYLLMKQEHKPNFIAAWNTRIDWSLSEDGWADIFTLLKSIIIVAKVIELKYIKYYTDATQQTA